MRSGATLPFQVVIDLIDNVLLPHNGLWTWAE